MIRVLYFGKLGDVTGKGEETLDVPEHVQNSEALRRWLDETRALSGALLEPTVRIAVNSEIAAGAVAVKAGDEVAFMPPVGGG